MRLIESAGKSLDMWLETTGIGNGDCILQKNEDN